MKINVDTTEDAVLIVKDGKVIKLDKPLTGYGENVVTWVNERIAADRVSYTSKR